jgi:hypothetical protein
MVSACALLASILWQCGLRAQTVTWTNAAGGAYSIGLNWSNGTGVGAGSASLFNLPGSYTVSFLASASAANSFITGGTVNFLGGPSRSYLLSGGLSMSGGMLNVSSLNIAATGSFSMSNGTLTPLVSSNLSSSTLAMSSTAGQTTLFSTGGGTTTSYRATSATGTSTIGGNGGTSIFSVGPLSTGTFEGNVAVAPSGGSTTFGQLIVLGPSTVNLNGNLYIAPGTSSAKGLVVVQVGTLKQNGSGGVTIGGTGTGVATLEVDNSSTLSTGTGVTQINANGLLLNSGTSTFGGDLNVNGGRFTQTTFFYPTQSTIAGTLSLNGGTVQFDAGTLTAHSLVVNSGVFDWNSTSGLDRMLTIDGGVLSTPSNSFAIGSTSDATSTETLRFTNGASYTGTLFFESASNAELQVLSGSSVSLSQFGVQFSGSGKTLRTLVSGANSVLDIGTAQFATRAANWILDVQGGGLVNVQTRLSAVEATNAINIKPGGTFFIADSALVRNDGVTNLSGGTLSILNTAALDPTGAGSVNFTAGTLRMRSSTTIDADFTNFALGAPSVLGFGKALQIDGTGTFTVPVQLNGGTLTLTGISGGTNLSLTSGTLNLNNPLSLSISAAGPLGGNIAVPSGLTINVSGNASSVTSAQLLVNGGSFNTGGTFTNNGEIQVVNNGRLIAGTLNNNSNGTITGNGRVIARLSNSGLIRSGPADFLRFQGVSNVNNGTVSLLGGVVEFTSGLTNNSGGTILGRGSLLVPGNLDNNGTLIFTGGAAELQGRLNNNATAKVTVTGGATASFYDPVTNSAGSVFKVSDASVAVFLGDVQGLSAFTGAGTIIFEGTTTPGPLAASGTAIVQSTATVQAESIRDNTLIVRGPTEIVPNGTSAATSRLNTLAIEEKGLNLNDNDLVIDYGASSPIVTIRGYLNDHLLYSDIADFSTTPKFALGYRENTDGLSTFSGQNVDTTSLLIAYTFAGDSNLDGKVNTIDFNQLAGAFGQTNQFWFNGDYDYNGNVNSLDFNLLVGNFGRSMPLNAPTLGAVVPEPACGLCVILVGWIAVSRRRMA